MMTREEAIQILSTRDAHGVLCGYTSGVTKALDMAIDALQFVKHFDLLKEYQSLQEVVRCKDCDNRHTDDCPMYHEEWYEIDEGDGYFDSDFTIHDYSKDDDFCSWAKMKGGAE